MRHYLGIAEPSNTGWCISFPAFPGVVSVGHGVSDLLQNATDALASVIAEMQADGLEIPVGFQTHREVDLSSYANPYLLIVPVAIGGTTIRINVTMNEGLVAELDALAEKLGTSRSALLARGAKMVVGS